MIEVAIKAAREAGEILNKRFVGANPITLKEDRSFVTESDKLSEEKIISIIKTSFPNHSFRAEESGFSNKNSEYEWIIDPLDGTTNYATHIPFFSISIALIRNKTLELGVIYDPVQNELFQASCNKGASLNGNQLKVSATAQLRELKVGYSRSHAAKERFVTLVSKIEKATRTPKILGSTALQLAYVAAGRIDADISLAQESWDIAAGTLIIKESDGEVTDFSGKEWSLETEDIVASNGKIHEELLRIINS